MRAQCLPACPLACLQPSTTSLVQARIAQGGQPTRFCLPPHTTSSPHTHAPRTMRVGRGGAFVQRSLLSLTLVLAPLPSLAMSMPIDQAVAPPLFETNASSGLAVRHRVHPVVNPDKISAKSTSFIPAKWSGPDNIPHNGRLLAPTRADATAAFLQVALARPLHAEWQHQQTRASAQQDSGWGLVPALEVLPRQSIILAGEHAVKTLPYYASGYTLWPSDHAFVYKLLQNPGSKQLTMYGTLNALLPNDLNAGINLLEFYSDGLRDVANEMKQKYMTTTFKSILEHLDKAALKPDESVLAAFSSTEWTGDPRQAASDSEVTALRRAMNGIPPQMTKADLDGDKLWERFGKLKTMAEAAFDTLKETLPDLNRQAARDAAPFKRDCPCKKSELDGSCREADHGLLWDPNQSDPKASAVFEAIYSKACPNDQRGITDQAPKHLLKSEDLVAKQFRFNLIQGVGTDMHDKEQMDRLAGVLYEHAKTLDTACQGDAKSCFREMVVAKSPPGNSNPMHRDAARARTAYTLWWDLLCNYAAGMSDLYLKEVYQRGDELRRTVSRNDQGGDQVLGVLDVYAYHIARLFREQKADYPLLTSVVVGLQELQEAPKPEDAGHIKGFAERLKHHISTSDVSSPPPEVIYAEQQKKAHKMAVGLVVISLYGADKFTRHRSERKGEASALYRDSGTQMVALGGYLKELRAALDKSCKDVDSAEGVCKDWSVLTVEDEEKGALALRAFLDCSSRFADPISPETVVKCQGSQSADERLVTSPTRLEDQEAKDYITELLTHWAQILALEAFLHCVQEKGGSPMREAMLCQQNPLYADFDEKQMMVERFIHTSITDYVEWQLKAWASSGSSDPSSFLTEQLIMLRGVSGGQAASKDPRTYLTSKLTALDGKLEPAYAGRVTQLEKLRGVLEANPWPLDTNDACGKLDQTVETTLDHYKHKRISWSKLQTSLDEWWVDVQKMACPASGDANCDFAGKNTLQDLSKGRQGTSQEDKKLRWASSWWYASSPWSARTAIEAAWKQVSDQRCLTTPTDDLIDEMRTLFECGDAEADLERFKGALNTMCSAVADTLRLLANPDRAQVFERKYADMTDSDKRTLSHFYLGIRLLDEKASLDQGKDTLAVLADNEWPVDIDFHRASRALRDDDEMILKNFFLKALVVDFQVGPTATPLRMAVMHGVDTKGRDNLVGKFLADLLMPPNQQDADGSEQPLVIMTDSNSEDLGRFNRGLKETNLNSYPCFAQDSAPTGCRALTTAKQRTIFQGQVKKAPKEDGGADKHPLKAFAKDFILWSGLEATAFAKDLVVWKTAEWFIPAKSTAGGSYPELLNQEAQPEADRAM